MRSCRLGTLWKVKSGKSSGNGVSRPIPRRSRISTYIVADEERGTFPAIIDFCTTENTAYGGASRHIDTSRIIRPVGDCYGNQIGVG